MSPSREVITRLYTAFAARDHEAMARCYTPDAHFSDPVFTDLHGPEVAAMWRMLCRRATDLRIAFRDVSATEDEGTAHWEAWYTYSGTGRSVHNVIDAAFTFRGGLIVRHIDRFDLYAWARQALGTRGLLLGWAPPVQAAIRRQAVKALTHALRLDRNGITRGP
ncbi:MAG: nuclear transport factor 2 family protein [Gemmatimonadales bacterium]